MSLFHYVRQTMYTSILTYRALVFPVSVCVYVFSVGRMFAMIKFNSRFDLQQISRRHQRWFSCWNKIVSRFGRQ